MFGELVAQASAAGRGAIPVSAARPATRRTRCRRSGAANTGDSWSAGCLRVLPVSAGRRYEGTLERARAVAGSGWGS